MSNSYKKGFDQGYNDAKSGKSKVNAQHFFAGVKNAANLMGSTKEFVKGYEEGYRKGSHDKKK